MLAKGFAHLGLILCLACGSGQAATVSDLLISEIMANPAALPDGSGEWFELYNPTDETVNLRDATLGDDGGDAHRIESDLLILPRHFLTLARSDAPGFTPDYVYSGFTLSNSGDEILLFDAFGSEALRLDYGAAFDAPGRSRELAALPMTESNYVLTLASLIYGLGDIGTPGRAGSGALVSAVPLPGAAWLFLTAASFLATRIPRQKTVIPRDKHVIPRLVRAA